MDTIDAVDDRGPSVGDGDAARFRQLFDAIDEGYCLCEMIVDEEGRAVDYRFLETNALFEQMTGLSGAVGRTALELVPRLERHWIDTYARVALGGERLRFQQGSAAMERWFDVFSMPLGEPRQFGIVFRDDTARQVAELELRRSEAQLREIAEREHRVALRLQAALLPDALAEHPELELVAHYAAADEVLDVGGDWYDTIAWPTGELAVIVGDVVGHDLDAASTMGRLRAGTRALAGTREPTPLAVLESLATCATGPDGTAFATAFVMVVDRDAERLRYASAGHPPALLVDPDGAVRRLDDATSPPVGRATGHDSFETRLVPFPAGSAVLLYTDGLVERRDEHIDVGLGRLEACAARLARCAGDALRDVLHSSMLHEHPTEDDMVLVRVTRGGDVAGTSLTLPQP